MKTISAGRTGRVGRKGVVTALVTKRDKVLSDAIQVSTLFLVYALIVMRLIS